MCITNIRQRNLSTNKGYRATFTKAQVGKDLGTEAGQYGSFYRFPHTHNALTAKNALVRSGHTPGGGTAAHQRSSRWCWNSLPVPGALGAACPAASADRSDTTGSRQRASSRRPTVLTRSPVRNSVIWLSSVRPS